MATLKAYTDLKQSEILSKILKHESADMYYWCGEDLRIGGHEAMDIEYDTPCWSLAALLNVLPTLDDRNAILCKDIRYDEWHICYYSTATLPIIDTERYDNPVDACVEMILKLHERKML